MATPSLHRTLATDEDCGGCGPGTCVEPTLANSQIESTTLGSVPSCDCKGTGFVGEHCEISCSRECLNGGKCVPSDGSEGGKFSDETCSCTKAVVAGNPYAGLNCEYGATKSCMTLGSDSKHSFCTNGGECADIVGDNERHRDCVCEEGFEGSHCEYVAGTMPTNVAASSATRGGTNESMTKVDSTSDVIVWTTIAVIAALIGVLLLAFGVRARKRRAEATQREKEAREATEELSMIPNQPENDII